MSRLASSLPIVTLCAALVLPTSASAQSAAPAPAPLSTIPLSSIPATPAGGVHPSGRYPCGGFSSSHAPTSPISRNTTPRMRKVGRQPADAMRLVAIGPMIAEPAP